MEYSAKVPNFIIYLSVQIFSMTLPNVTINIRYFMAFTTFTFLKRLVCRQYGVKARFHRVNGLFFQTTSRLLQSTGCFLQTTGPL